MKNPIALSLLTLLALPAFGGNEGPQAAPPLPRPYEIASILTGGGMPTPGGTSSTKIAIMDDGAVTKTFYAMGVPTTTSIAQLTPGALASLKATVDAIEPGALTDPNPASPGCEDAPSTSYSVTNSKSVQIEIGEKINCKDMQRANASYEDQKVEAVLNGFEALAN